MECELITTFTGHHDSVECLCYKHNTDEIFSADRNAKLKKWNRSNSKPIFSKSLSGRNVLSSLLLKDGTLLFSGHGSTIDHYKNEKDIQNIFPIKQTNSPFLNFLYMIEIDDQGNIFLYDSFPYNGLHNLYIFNVYSNQISIKKTFNHGSKFEASHLGVDFKDDIIAISSGLSISFFESSTLEFIKKIDLFKCGKIKFLSDGNLAASGIDDIEIWDWKNDKLDRVLGYHKDVRDLLEIKEGFLLSCGGDKLIKMWDVHLGICLGSIDGHQWGINKMIKMEKFMFITASDDETVKIWRLKIQNIDYLKLVERKKLIDINFQFKEQSVDIFQSVSKLFGI
jgi:WD40 repeat protein